MKNRNMWFIFFSSPAVLFGAAETAYAAPALEEVFVTAEKRVESLQDVPISIVAFNQTALENLGISDIKDLAAKVPNVQRGEFTGS